MTNPTKDNADYESIEQLLPWYVTGKLEAHERLEVEIALKRFPELQTQLELIRSEMTETVSANQTEAMPRKDATARFMRLIQKDLSPPVAAAPSPFKAALEWLAQQFAAPPRWAVAAAVLALLVQATLIGALVFEREADGYHTATGGTSLPAGGTLVLVRFADGVTVPILTERLAASGITIVDGPKAGGLFTLRIGPEKMTLAERDKKIEALKAEAGLVMFIGPMH